MFRREIVLCIRRQCLVRRRALERVDLPTTARWSLVDADGWGKLHANVAGVGAIDCASLWSKTLCASPDGTLVFVALVDGQPKVERP